MDKGCLPIICVGTCMQLLQIFQQYYNFHRSFLLPSCQIFSLGPFKASANEITFFMSLSQSFLLAYINAASYVNFVSYKFTEFIHPNRFGFLRYINHVICKQGPFDFILSNLNALYFFFLLNYFLASTPGTLSNKNGKSEKILSLVLDGKEKAFSFPHRL